MIAVIRTGGKQYIVSPGSKITVEKLDKNEGDKVEFNEVLLREEKDGKLSLGTPYIEGAKVTGKVVENKRGEKKMIFKYKPKKRHKVKKGHAQNYTEVEIEKV